MKNKIKSVILVLSLLILASCGKGLPGSNMGNSSGDFTLTEGDLVYAIGSSHFGEGATQSGNSGEMIDCRASSFTSVLNKIGMKIAYGFYIPASNNCDPSVCVPQFKCVPSETLTIDMVATNGPVTTLADVDAGSFVHTRTPTCPAGGIMDSLIADSTHEATAIRVTVTGTYGTDTEYIQCQ